MDLLGVTREALGVTWRSKGLWIFGLFVAAAGAGATGGGGAAGDGAAALPAWAPALAGAGTVAGLAALWMHVVAEGALIAGAHRSRRGGRVRANEGFRAGRARFGPVLRVKLVALGAVAIAAAAFAVPVALAETRLVPPRAAVAVVVSVAIAGAPALLTAHFVYAYALRFAVLDGTGARDALSAGWRFLHGRVLESVKLFVLAFAVQLGGGLAAALAAAPGALAGGLLYLATGASLPAALAGGALAVPPALAVAGAAGAFRSAVWTLGFLESRAAGSP